MVLAGATETHNANKGAFQEFNAVSLIEPYAKLAVCPPHPEVIPSFIEDAYRIAMFGRPGPTFVELPADLILGHFDVARQKLSPLTELPRSLAPENKIRDVVQAIKSAKAPLVVFGKGAAYARAEKQIRTLIER